MSRIESISIQSAGIRNLRRTLHMLPIVACAVLLPQYADAAEANKTGTISGRVVDGNERAVENAVVFLCAADSGLPILAKTGKPLVLKWPFENFRGLNDVRRELTDQDGGFKFDDVPAGRYRLVAQSWPGAVGIPDFLKEKNDKITLHGVAEGVVVAAERKVEIKITPLGSGTLKIENDPKANHAFLFISLRPRLGEGVLGPRGWGPGFLSGLIAATQMEQTYVTIQGLPDGKDVHVGLINYDNNPGIGGDTYRVGKDRVVRLDIFATWSNGKYEPPARLAKLTDYLEENNFTAARFLGLEGGDIKNYQALWKEIDADPKRLFDVEGIGKFRLIDIYAAARHKELRAHHRRRKR